MQFVKSCSPWEAPTLQQVMETVSRERDPTLEQGQSVRGPPSEEEGVAETTCDELTTAPMPHPSAPLGGRR